jgi:hypothetical protein
MRVTIALLLVLIALVTFTTASELRCNCIRAPCPCALSDSEKFKIGKALKSIGKGALKVGKAYVGQKYGVQLADEEEMSEKKIKIDDVFNWLGKGKQIYDIFKGRSEEEEESDLRFNADKIAGYIQKAKEIRKLIRRKKADKPAEVESEKFKIGKALKSIGKGALKVGKAYVGQKYGIQLSESGHKLSNADGLNRIRSAGIGISSSGGCHDRQNKRCTSLDQINSGTIDGISTLKRASGCPITITGGSETGHAGGAMSHYNGYKVDIALNACIDSYITRSFANAGRRGDGAQMYKSSAGNIYAKEGNHWDITYL